MTPIHIYTVILLLQNRAHIINVAMEFEAQGKTDVIPEVVQEDITGLRMQMTIPSIGAR